ncbi:hypothetical protein [Paraburkholderia sp. UCT31]|uniref:hypothetical protein n=1 Tax=Paraburkholderia sp. UCT31 TaxID=2615209 RepID=UPI00223C36CD|nr:hypothetical protein [Paraburkholderia sp. UCT31]
MNSEQVKKADYVSDEDKGRYSPLKVMQSAAGYYVGTSYRNPLGFNEPGSRDSEYFPTHAAATLELDRINAGGQQKRTHPASGLASSISFVGNL